MYLLLLPFLVRVNCYNSEGQKSFGIPVPYLIPTFLMLIFTNGNWNWGTTNICATCKDQLLMGNRVIEMVISNWTKVMIPNIYGSNNIHVLSVIYILMVFKICTPVTNIFNKGTSTYNKLLRWQIYHFFLISLIGNSKRNK